MGWALLQTPLSRFGDAAANSGMRELLSTTALPMGVQTACAGLAAALWRVSLTPLDTLKTTLQVEGAAAYALLVQKGAGGRACCAGALRRCSHHSWAITRGGSPSTISTCPDLRNGPLAPSCVATRCISHVRERHDLELAARAEDDAADDI